MKSYTLLNSNNKTITNNDSKSGQTVEKTCEGWSLKEEVKGYLEPPKFDQLNARRFLKQMTNYKSQENIEMALHITESNNSAYT